MDNHGKIEMAEVEKTYQKIRQAMGGEKGFKLSPTEHTNEVHRRYIYQDSEVNIENLYYRDFLIKKSR